eukprot:SAG22_NODE_2088_length_3030_cov_7.531900_2_plen_76_part_00
MPYLAVCLPGWSLQTEADAGEYDVVKAPAGTAPQDTVYQITAHFQVCQLTLPPSPVPTGCCVRNSDRREGCSELN